MTVPANPSKRIGKGMRHCCRNDDCSATFDNRHSMAAHMSSAHRVHERGPIEHGTVQGYRAEARRGIPTCEECRRAWRTARRLGQLTPPKEDV